MMSEFKRAVTMKSEEETVVFTPIQQFDLEGDDSFDDSESSESSDDSGSDPFEDSQSISNSNS